MVATAILTSQLLQKAAEICHRFAAGTANATKPQMGYGDAGGGDGFQMLHIWNIYNIYKYCQRDLSRSTHIDVLSCTDNELTPVGVWLKLPLLEKGARLRRFPW